MRSISLSAVLMLLCVPGLYAGYYTQKRALEQQRDSTLRNLESTYERRVKPLNDERRNAVGKASKEERKAGGHERDAQKHRREEDQHRAAIGGFEAEIERLSAEYEGSVVTTNTAYDEQIGVTTGYSDRKRLERQRDNALKGLERVYNRRVKPLNDERRSAVGKASKEARKARGHERDAQKHRREEDQHRAAIGGFEAEIERLTEQYNQAVVATNTRFDQRIAALNKQQNQQPVAQPAVQRQPTPMPVQDRYPASPVPAIDDYGSDYGFFEDDWGT